MSQPTFASALSTAATADEAIREATGQISDQMGDRSPDLVVAFVSHQHGSALETLGPRIVAETGCRMLMGCTGESIIGEAREIEEGPALSLWAVAAEGMQLTPLECRAGQGDGKYTFSQYPEVSNPESATLLLLGDPFSFPMGDYLEELNERLPGLRAIGGMASGGMGPGQNLLLTNEGIQPMGALGVVIEGGIELLPAVSQGCRPVGKPYVITAADENYIVKLGGKPAAQLLQETLEGLPSEEAEIFRRGPFVGLALDATKSAFERDDFLVRGIMALRKEDAAIGVADPSIRVGMTVQFLARDASSAGEDLVDVLKRRTAGVDSGPVGALVFSCNGRGTRMFERENHDISFVQSAFDSPIPAAGFFAMGEIGPVGGKNHLHGFTASVAVFRGTSG